VDQLEIFERLKYNENRFKALRILIIYWHESKAEKQNKD